MELLIYLFHLNFSLHSHVKKKSTNIPEKPTTQNFIKRPKSGNNISFIASPPWLILPLFFVKSHDHQL